MAWVGLCEGNGSVNVSELSFCDSCEHISGREEYNSPFLLQFLNFWDGHAKDEDILIPHLFPHLHVGSIQSPHCQCSICLYIYAVWQIHVYPLFMNIYNSLHYAQHMYIYMIN